jgi:transglutaminase-like putative cysteine protease
MMLHVRHLVEYSYDAPVVLEPHTLHMHVRPGPGVAVLKRQLLINPAPCGTSLNLGLDGALEEVAWFHGPTQSLSVACDTQVETSPMERFNFVMLPGSESLPLACDGPPGAMLQPYMKPDVPCDAITRFAAQALQRANGFPPAFASELCTAIHDRCTCIVRPEGPAWPPDETWSREEGACRDLAVLYIAAARSQGLPARFVSGYYHADADAPDNELHAWVEVYFPGGGWRGFDPTSGLGAAERHIALASAPEADGTTPVAGTFRGSATATMTASVRIRCVQR